MKKGETTKYESSTVLSTNTTEVITSILTVYGKTVTLQFLIVTSNVCHKLCICRLKSQLAESGASHWDAVSKCPKPKTMFEKSIKLMR